MNFSVLGHRKKIGLKEQSVYKGDNTRTLPNTRGPERKLSRSEELESNMVYVSIPSWEPGPEQSSDTLADKSGRLWGCDFHEPRVHKSIPTLYVLDIEEKPPYGGDRGLQEYSLFLHFKGLH